ncbi:retrotransposon-like protein 1 [Entomophthora muscae]|uniref:Retrotransposon-like protein 1 n=1 Tax=Entomophthora muscae TaxID=34485 RepID=A0ACC2T702_9FUNG|nr:retrotransposon-like protein 1 [Entomophthora muscae]
MIQHLMQEVGGNMVTFQQSTQPLFLEAPPMLNCLQGQQDPATTQGPLSYEVSQSLVSPASPLAIASLSSPSPQGIPILAALSLYEIGISSSTLANLSSTDSQVPTSGNTTNAFKLICFNQNCTLLSAKAQAIVDLHVFTMNKVAPAPCLEPIAIKPVIEQPFLALNEDLLSIKTAPQVQVLNVILVLCAKEGLCRLLSFSITDHAFVADFTVVKHLIYLVILDVEWCQDYNITPILKDNLLSITHPARIFLEVPMILFGKKAPHISMSVSTTIKHTTSFDVLLSCLSHLHTAFDSKLADGLPAHSQFDFEFKLTVDLVKVASPIYPLNLKEEQCLEEWIKDMEAKGQIFRKSSPLCSSLLFVQKSDGSLCP